MSVKVLITRLDPSVPLPSYAKPGDAGADLATRIDFTLKPGERALIPTGISLALPKGYVALVHPRSGLAIKHGISLVNTPGTVDAAYRGELQCIGASTLDEYRMHIEKDGALDRRFQKVIVEPPSVDEAIQILTNIKSRYEEYHNVEYSNDYIVILSNNYLFLL